MALEFVQDPRNRLVFTKIEQIPELTRRSIRQGWFMLGRDLMQTASKEILRKPKGGRTYIVRIAGGRRRRHVASAPGETHANLSGKARRSLGYQVSGYQSMEFGYGVDKNAPEYVGFLEGGTTRMAARPSLLNAINATTRNAENYFNNEFKRLVK